MELNHKNVWYVAIPNPEIYNAPQPNGSSVTVNSHRRAIVAAILALVYPGLGHAYLRSWGRAVLWFGAVVATALVLIPNDIVMGISSIGDISAAWSAVPIEAAIGVMLVAVFNAVDAYWTGKRSMVAQDELRCPSCGRVLDEDLSFCHWCTIEYTVETN